MLETGLPNRPRLHRSYHVLTVPDSDEIQLQSDGRALRLQPLDSSGLLQSLLTLLDGTRTVDEILSVMSSYDRAQVVDSLHRLHDSRLLEDASPTTAYLSAQQQDFYASQLTFLAHFVADPDALQARLGQSTVAVLGLGATGERVVTALAGSGVGRLVGIAWPEEQTGEWADIHQRLAAECDSNNPWGTYYGVTLADNSPESISEAAGESRLLIVALEGQDPELLERVNLACNASGQTWMPVGLRAWEGFVGPTVIPGETACYTCYSLRAKANLTEYEPYQRYEDQLKSGTSRRTFGSLPHFSTVVAGLATIEATKTLTRFAAPLTIGRMLTFDYLSFTGTLHPILKLPRCPVCGVSSQHIPMSNPWAG